VTVVKALSWEEETRLERLFAEYPAHGVVREVAVDARRTVEHRSGSPTSSTARRHEPTTA